MPFFSLDLIGVLCGLVLCLIITICCIATYKTPCSSAQKRLTYHKNEMVAANMEKGQKQQREQKFPQPLTPQPLISSQMSASKLRAHMFALSFTNRNHRRRSNVINRSGKRNLAKLLCRTDSPSCLSERKEVVKFSEDFEVELHFTLNRPIISLMCRVSAFFNILLCNLISLYRIHVF